MSGSRRAAESAATRATAVTLVTAVTRATAVAAVMLATAVTFATAVIQGIAGRHVRPRACVRSAIMTSGTGVGLRVQTLDRMRARMALGPSAVSCFRR
jgi:hypothetical protein